MRGNKQCRRRYVVPNDPRTAGQLRARAAFGAASKTWSESPELTEEQREAWRKEAAKVQSRPRLSQSGPLTGQQHYVGRRCAKGQIGREENAEGRGQMGEATLQVVQSQSVAQSTREAHRRCVVVAPCQGRKDRGWARKGEGKKAALQAQQYQRVAQSAWEHYRGAPGVPHWQCHRGTGRECRMLGAEVRMRNGGETRGRRRGLWRGLWHA